LRADGEHTFRHGDGRGSLIRVGREYHSFCGTARHVRSVREERLNQIRVAFDRKARR
jgi:hypothetical protein